MNYTPKKYVYKYLNLGCEMIFILDQRLRDSKIEFEKKKRVLSEVLDRFLSDEEVYKINDDLFKEQFNRIAHSSIMKLNENSMTLEDMFVNIDPGMRNRVRNYFTNIIAPRFTPLPMLQWAKLRRQILNDYEDLHIRVSLLLRKQVQLDDSRFILRKAVPSGFLPAGLTKMTESNREITWKTASSMEDVEVETKNAKTYRQMRNCKLGENVYDDTKKSAHNLQTGVYTEERNVMSHMLGFDDDISDMPSINLLVLEDDVTEESAGSLKPVEGDWNVVKCEKHENKEIQQLISSLQKTATKVNTEPEDLLSLMDSLN